MTLSKLFRTLGHTCALSGALLIGSASGQDLLPSVSFSAASGSFGTDGNWTLDGSDPPESGVPGDGEIAVIGGGVANVDGAAGPVHSLSVSRGTLNLGDGGALEVANQTIVGGSGTLGAHGGILNTGSLAVFGTVDVPADFDLSFGSSIPVATTASLNGTPRGYTVGGSRVSLPLGLGLGLVPTDAGASVVVESLPVPEVDRATGEVTISNIAGGPIELAGYSVSSAGSLLRRSGGAWNSLEDQGISGWEEANPGRNDRFSELNLTSSTTLAVGDTWNIGNIYTGIGEPPAKEDIKFEFLLGDGRVVSPRTQYAGAPNDLFLSIDPETGEASLNHTSELIDPFDVIAISILSDSGSLNPPAEALLGEGWTNANPQDVAYTEVSLDGSRVFAQGDSLSLGGLWDTAGSQDLEFTFATTDGAVRTGSVLYGDSVAAPPEPPACNPNSGGDLDGNGRVEFADFLALSANFGQAVADHTQGDINCDGTVAFSDFLVLSSNFGQAVGAEAASVPEPASGLMFFLGFLGMLKFRKRASRVAVVAAAVTLCCAASQDTFAQEFDYRFIRLHPAGPNNTIANITEATAIATGNVHDALFNEDLTGTLAIVDVGGGAGQFTFDQSPYLNGVEDESMSNFLQVVSGTVTIPAGDWTIGCGSDDGCQVTFSNPEISFDNTYNENGSNLVDGDGTILFNAGRGHDWTFGTFSVASDTTTGIQIITAEGGGGDSFEAAIFSDIITAEEVGTGDDRRLTAGLFAELPGFGDSEWEITGDPYVSIAGDFNADGVVNGDDADILTKSFGEDGGFADGDINYDGTIDFHDAALFKPILAAASGAGEASVVPEPGSVSLILVGLASLLGFRRRKRA